MLMVHEAKMRFSFTARIFNLKKKKDSRKRDLPHFLRLLNVNHSEIEISNTVHRESFHGNSHASKLENKREKFRLGDQHEISVLEIQKDSVKNNSRQITLAEVQTIKENKYPFQISYSQTTLSNVEKQNMTHQNRMKQRPVSCVSFYGLVTRRV